MQHFNSFTCEARIAKQFGVKKLPDNRCVCMITIVHEGANDEKLWLNCSMFSTEKRAEFLSGLKPGQPIYVTGRLKPDTYNGKQSFKLDIYDFGLPPLKKDNGNDPNGSTAESSPTTNNAPQESVPEAPPESDVPF